MAAVLVTGGSGLIGQWVTTFWPPEIQLISATRADGDLADPGVFSAVVARFRPDAVLHLAWCASGDPGYRNSGDNDRWVASSLAAAQTCFDLGIRFIGTGTVLDDRPGDDAYSSAKHRLRTELSAEAKFGEITWLRPFYVFDPERGRPALMAAVRDARLSGLPVPLRAPRWRHDFVLAADVGTAIVAALQSDLKGCVDIGSGTTRSVAEVVEALGATWRPGPTDEGATRDRPADVRALRRTGWSPLHTERLFAHG